MQQQLIYDIDVNNLDAIFLLDIKIITISLDLLNDKSRI